MAKKLYVPDYQVEALEQTKNKKVGELEKAYIKTQDRVLDPSKLSEKAVDRMPQPTGWRILLLPFQGRKQTTGGILVPDETRDREAVGTVCGYVLRVGNLAYKDDNKFGAGEKPWCKEGDWVIFGRYAGSRFKIEGGEVRILNDDEILATITDPEDILHL
jgi:chaperonin GroES|tara:strand:+ start:1193 stop:1672 length:480 start_codon:yes stop_codon:yes gene_type:complete